jgi:hypothetical protein
MPFATLTIGTAFGTDGPSRAKVARMYWVGIAQTTSVAEASAEPSEPTSTAACRRKPGSRALSRLSRRRAASAANGETIDVGMPRTDRMSARTRAIWPSPTIAIRSERSLLTPEG